MEAMSTIPKQQKAAQMYSNALVVGSNVVVIKEKSFECIKST